MSSSAAYRWGRAIARHRRLVLGIWVLVLIVCAASYPALKSSLGAPNYGIDKAESTHAEQLLEQRFAGHGAEQDVLVFYSPERRTGETAYRAVVTRTLELARRQNYVKGIAGPYDRGARRQISADRHSAIALVGIAGDPRQLVEHANHLQRAVDPLAGAGVRVWLTGYSPVSNDITAVENKDVERAETIGVPVALLVLLLALGAVMAALLPLAIAGSGLLLTYGVLALLATTLTFDSFLTTIVTMIGVGVGIDYALFIVSRFREELAQRMRADGRPSTAGVGPETNANGRERAIAAEQVEDAVGAAIASSGRTILFSGAVVALALSTLVVIRAPIFREFALGAASVVICTVIVALTLLPAVLALLGDRINKGALPARMQPRDSRLQETDGHGVWARWALAVMRRPVLAAGTIVAVLLLASTPVLKLHTGIDFGISSLSGTPSGKGEQVLARSFGAGTLAPIEIVLSSSRNSGRLSRADTTRAARLERELAPTGRNGIAGVTMTPGRDATLLTVAPTTPIDSYSSEQLVRHIRAELLPPLRSGGLDIAVGGATAKVVDLSNETKAKFPLVLGLILTLSLLFLTVVFRSLVLPVKAIAMNLLATSATVGIVIFIFQEAHGEHLLGFSSVGFIQVYLPLSIFALLFGLSMDYEVFLIRRMRETWLQSNDNELAVATGVEHTARPISAAAAIMVAVFGSFVTANVLELKQFGLALALAIAIDATLIRLVLVPALMRLFGARNWWLPRFSRPAAAKAPVA
jgi:putative drug exporter of the RND superfamily